MYIGYIVPVIYTTYIKTKQNKCGYQI